ncbi:MAG: CoA-binding protein [FCB group bacterium]
MDFLPIFKNYKNIAVYGMSKNPAKPSNSVPVYLMEQGYNIIPINPTIDEIEGKKSYSKLMDVPDKIEILDVFRPSEQALSVVEEAVERKRVKGDVNLIWLQEGIISEDAKMLAEKNNIAFVQDKCMRVEYLKVNDMLL